MIVLVKNTHLLVVKELWPHMSLYEREASTCKPPSDDIKTLYWFKRRDPDSAPVADHKDLGLQCPRRF
jgi:hypothetical protein